MANCQPATPQGIWLAPPQFMFDVALFTLVALRIAPIRNVVALDAAVFMEMSQTPFCPVGTAHVALAVVVGLLMASKETVRHALAAPPVGQVIALAGGIVGSTLLIVGPRPASRRSARAIIASFQFRWFIRINSKL